MSDKQRLFRRLLYLFLIVRLAMVGVTVSNPTGSLMIDSPEYLTLAAEFAETGSYGIPSDPVPELFRPPIYAGLLAVIQQIMGPETYNITFYPIAVIQSHQPAHPFTGHSAIQTERRAYRGLALCVEPKCGALVAHDYD